MKTKVLLIAILMVFTLSNNSYCQLDWGDAPDPTYPTLSGNNGAFHQIWPGIQMGIYNDPEVNGQPNATATGDDYSTQDDADGVIFNSWVIAGQNASVIITVSGPPGMIDAWIDYNIDGDWQDIGEQIFMNQFVTPGTNNLTFNVPTLAAAGVSFTRIRYSIPGGLSFVGFAPDGEVEDYQLWLGPPPMGDTYIDPDPTMSFTQNEISLAVDSDPNFGPPPLIVAAYNDEPFPGGPGIGVSYSTDAGSTWNNTHLVYPNDPFSGVPFIDVFDPTVCIDDSGHVFVGHIATDNNWAGGPTSGLYVHKSTDGGITWHAPVQIDADNTASGSPDPNYRLNDRDQIVADNYIMSPYYNNIYITWIKDRGWYMPLPYSDIYFSFSTDGGNSFSTAVQINTMTNNMGNMPVPDVAKDGTVYVAWMDYNVLTGGIGNIFLDKSTDGGVTFGADIPVYPVNLPPINLNGTNTGTRAKGAAVLKVMPSNPQELYIVFAEDPVNPIDESDIFLIKSTNGGNTWSSPVRVNDDITTNDQILPWMDIKPNGTIDIAWYDRRNDPFDLQWDVYFTSSIDGGITFTPNTKVNTNSFNTPTPVKVGDKWMGEYLGLAADYNNAYIVHTTSTLDNKGDVVFTQTPNPATGTDWGDAPDPTYPTLAINNGASHINDGVTYLGNTIDSEPDGIPGIGAEGDDFYNMYDEDGVVFPALRKGKTDNLNITASTSGILNAWFDFNSDGDWDDGGEYVLVNIVLVGGINNVPITVPSGAIVDTTYARFRFASYGVTNYVGGATDGEVEDYRIVILDSVPSITYVDNETIGSTQSKCYNATDSLIVASTGPVVIQSGADAIFIAGNLILFNPGFDANIGSVVNAHITTSNNYCTFISSTPIVANSVDLFGITEVEEYLATDISNIKLYPNPNTGQFTIDLGKEEHSANIRIMNFQGTKLYENQFRNQQKITLDLSTQSTGIYLVMIRIDSKVFTKKVIKK